MVHVVSLHVYPVKSCAGIDLTRARVERRGLAGDRRWMIVREDGMFVTQREEPRLSLVRTAFSGDGVTLTYDGERLELPRALAAGERTTVQVWASTVDALEHAPARAFVSRASGGPARLVYMPDETRRSVDPRFGAAGDIVSFADGYPLLLASTSSREEVERRVGQPMPMTRFRPNVVVTGSPAFAEDAWRRVKLGSVAFRAPKLCDRCGITTVDPATGERGREPLKTLATFRKWDGQVWFAVNLVPDAEGELEVGDAVELLASE